MRFPIVTIAISVVFVADIASSVTWTELVTVTAPTPISVYYDCGSRFISEEFIQKTIRWYTERNTLFDRPFQELLYDLKPNYWKLLVPGQYSVADSSDPHKQYSVFYIIIDQMSHFVDLVTEMKNGHFIKCKRVDESVPEPSHDDPNVKYNYKCGHDLFSHEVIQFSVETAVSSMGKSTIYPTPYWGNLYKTELKYWIYPVLRANRVHKIRKLPEDTYFVVVSADGKLIDVIAELVGNGSIKCTKTTEVSDINLNEDLLVGYVCGVEFFDINYMKRTAELAMAKYRWEMNKMSYPRIFDGPPFHENHWIYPLLPNGMFYGGVSHQLFHHFLVMNLRFEVEFAAVKTAEKMYPCEATMRGLDVAPQETDGFRCENFEFPNETLRILAGHACQALGTRARRFPAKYEGPPFSIQGPYVTWPISQGMKLTGRPGNYRIVMNTECKLAGVIAKTKNEFYKCRRSTDDSIPGDISTEPIKEILSVPNKDKINFRRRMKTKLLRAETQD